MYTFDNGSNNLPTPDAYSGESNQRSGESDQGFQLQRSDLCYSWIKRNAVIPKARQGLL
jgi:hypothetical protein